MLRSRITIALTFGLAAAITVGFTAALGADQAKVESATAPHGAIAANLTALHDYYFGDLRAAAEMLDAKHFGYRPTEGVRSVEELLAHVAQASRFTCAVMLDQPPPTEVADLEKQASALGKQGLLDALGSAHEACTQAFRSLDPSEISARSSRALGPIVFGGQQVRRGAMPSFQIAHVATHYGNLVTYLRMLGIEPPSTTRFRALDAQ